MESPHNGRADIEDNIYGYKIAIPSKKNWLFLIFFGFWLVMWTIGIIIIIINATFSNPNDSMPGAIILLVICFWAIVMIIPLRIFLWNAIGKELITFASGVLTIDKKGLLFYKAKSYDLNEARKFRVQEDPIASIMPFGITPFRLFRMSNSGTIKFDYGMQTIKFADGVDEAEASFILERLRSKKLIQ